MHPKQKHIVDVYGKQPETLDEVAEAIMATIDNIDPVVGFVWDINYNGRIRHSYRKPIDTYGLNEGVEKPFWPGFEGRVWIRYADSPKETFGASGNFEHTLSYTGTGGGGAYNGPWSKLSHEIYNARYRDDFGKIVKPYPEPRIWSWDYRFYIGDWPGLWDELTAKIIAHEHEEEKRKVWTKLRGGYFSKNNYKHHHKFAWFDPATVAEDERILAECEGRLMEGVLEWTS